jgi:Holliday junction DNA helicase RuvA
MIAKLTGRLDSCYQDSIIIDVNGVGYHVYCSTRTMSGLPVVGETAALLIDTHVREDHFHLYGFLDANEQYWFRLLTGVQGVGTRAGLAILSASPVDKLAFSIAAGDKTPLTQADGVGPKLANRIVTELKDKAGNLAGATTGVYEMDPGLTTQHDAQSSGAQSSQSIDDDSVSALVNLGYSRTDAFTAVARAKKQANDACGVQELIRLALKELSA